MTAAESRRTLEEARRINGPVGSAARGIASQPASPRPPCGGAGLRSSPQPRCRCGSSTRGRSPRAAWGFAGAGRLGILSRCADVTTSCAVGLVGLPQPFGVPDALAVLAQVEQAVQERAPVLLVH